MQWYLINNYNYLWLIYLAYYDNKMCSTRSLNWKLFYYTHKIEKYFIALFKWCTTEITCTHTHKCYLLLKKFIHTYMLHMMGDWLQGIYKLVMKGREGLFTVTLLFPCEGWTFLLLSRQSAPLMAAVSHQTCVQTLS